MNNKDKMILGCIRVIPNATLYAYFHQCRLTLISIQLTHLSPVLRIKKRCRVNWTEIKIGRIQKHDRSPSAHWAIEDDWLDLKVRTNHLRLFTERSMNSRASECTHWSTLVEMGINNLVICIYVMFFTCQKLILVRK